MGCNYEIFNYFLSICNNIAEHLLLCHYFLGLLPQILYLLEAERWNELSPQIKVAHVLHQFNFLPNTRRIFDELNIQKEL